MPIHPGAGMMGPMAPGAVGMAPPGVGMNGALQHQHISYNLCASDQVHVLQYQP